MIIRRYFGRNFSKKSNFSTESEKKKLEISLRAFMRKTKEHIRGLQPFKKIQQKKSCINSIALVLV
jgi:hypothetical protein